MKVLVTRIGTALTALRTMKPTSLISNSLTKSVLRWSQLSDLTIGRFLAVRTNA